MTPFALYRTLWSRSQWRARDTHGTSQPRSARLHFL